MVIELADTELQPDVADVSVQELKAKEKGRRKFTISVVVAVAAVIGPYLFVLWDLWGGTINPFRSVGPSNYYDLQAQAMAHGHLYVPNESLGIEGFVHDGHTYTYFGIFPSLLRFPFLAVFPFLDGHLTGPFILFSWAVTILFSALLLWRVRILLRGNAAMGWSEAISCGAVVAAIAGGSVLIYLAANPWVYDEDFAWSVALMAGALFALLGVMESPGWRRIIFVGVLILADDLDRLTTGWACVMGAVFVAVWFAVGRGGSSNRRWTGPVLAAGLIPLAIGGVVTWMKFGNPFSLPLSEQVWTQINAHRRFFLASNGGKGFGLQFLPTTLWAYLKPTGLAVSPIFPFLSAPTTGPAIVGNAVFDQVYSTASITASMPLLFVLSVWGTVTAFRPHAVGRIRFARLPLLAAAAATGGVLLWGYIADRYLADFMPFVILAGLVGLADIWRRFSKKSAVRRRVLTGVTVALCLFSVAANVGAAFASMNSWTSVQATNYVAMQNRLSVGSLGSTVEHGSRLPYYAPAGQLFNINNCSGFYLSSGTSYVGSPGQQLQHRTWIPIEQGPGINHFFSIVLTKPPIQIQGLFPILSYGKTVVALQDYGEHAFRIVIENPSNAPSWPPSVSAPFYTKANHLYLFSVMTDPYLNSVAVRKVPVKNSSRIPNALLGGIQKGGLKVDHFLAGPGPAVPLPPPSQATAAAAGLKIDQITGVKRTTSLCQQLG